VVTHPSRLVSCALTVLLTLGALALAPSPAQAVDPVAGAQTSGDTQFPNVGNGGYDVLDYDIAMVWTPATIPGVTSDQSIVATTTISAATTGAPLSSFSLDFEGLTIDSVTVNGAPAAHTRVQVPADIKYKLVVTPAVPVDGAFTTVVSYHGTPVEHEDADGSPAGWIQTADGAVFLNQPVGSMTGFPNNNTPQDKATYTFTLNVPTTIAGGASAAVANGVLTSKTAVAGSRTQWVWDVAKPMPSELSLISIGRYNESTSTISLASGTSVQEWSYVDPTASGSGYAATRAALKSYIEFFEARYGPYPGNSIGLVVDNTATTGIGYALETQDRPFFPGSVSTGTAIHEVMHQWFGNNVSPEFWSDLWLNEGPATYAEVQLPNEAGTETAFFNQWNGTAGNSGTWTTPAADPDDDDPSDLFESHVYDRGAMALEALRTAIGASTFADLMREWQDRYGGGTKGTEDFIALAEELSGRQLDAFFQDWIFDADKPAWPGRFGLALATTPAAGPVAAGAPVTYKLSVSNTGKVALSGAVVTLDLADVLDDATIGTLPANTSRAGDTITWTVPTVSLGATASVDVPVTVSGGAGGHTLGATARASTLGSTCATCTSTLAVASDPVGPVSPSTVPTIDDTTPQVGQSLTATPGAWDPAATLAYEWQADGTPTGTNSAAYAVQASDLGKALTVSVTGTRSGFQTVTKTSLPTADVTAADQVSTPTPVVTGDARVGETLSANAGTWDPGVTLGYQWSADGAPVTGATAPTYAVPAGDLGRQLTVTVTGTRAGYATVSRTSAPTPAVAPGVLGSAPTPTIRGKAKVGKKLTAVPGQWQAGVTLTYQWFVGTKAVDGATGPRLKVRKAWVGKRIRLKVTGAKPGYAPVTMASKRTGKVL